jgi:hypothetical protein
MLPRHLLTAGVLPLGASQSIQDRLGRRSLFPGHQTHEKSGGLPVTSSTETRPSVTYEVDHMRRSHPHHRCNVCA